MDRRWNYFLGAACALGAAASAVIAVRGEGLGYIATAVICAAGSLLYVARATGWERAP